jgi:hypothetical protein
MSSNRVELKEIGSCDLNSFFDVSIVFDLDAQVVRVTMIDSARFVDKEYILNDRSCHKSKHVQESEMQNGKNK